MTIELNVEITHPVLEPGDILLSRVDRRSNWVSRLIAWGQKRIIHKAPPDADYCHAALVGPDALHLYEARWPKIRNIAIDWKDLTSHGAVEVYRVKDITPAQVDLVLKAAYARLGEWYDVLTILTFGTIQLGPASVCSQYIWECFTYADVVLCPWQNLESPDDLAVSTRLRLVL